MLEIEYRGGNAIVFTAKKTRVVADPNLSSVKLKNVIVGADDIELVTEERFASTAQPKLRINGPGEYEVGEFAILGLPTVRHIDTSADGSKSTLYRIGVNDVRIVLLGNVAPKLTDGQLESLGVVDVVILPVGGNGYTLDATAAAAMVKQLDPKCVIPVHYADSAIKYEVAQDALEVFSNELGAPVIDAGPKWKLKSAATLPDQLTMIKIARG